MIDFIKIVRLPVDMEILMLNPLLDFPIQASEKTGAIDEKTSRVSEYNGMKFIIKTDQYGNPFVKLEGSLHKYDNRGLHNFDQFDYNRLVNAIDHLCQKFNIEAEKTILNGLEFGVNILLDYSPNKFLDSVLDHKGVQFNKSKGRIKYFREAIHNNYIVKLYNKGLQFELEQHILRFEIKVMRMQHLKRIGITKLSDLLDKGKLLALGHKLATQFNDILIYDTSINLSKINERDRQILLNGTSPIYWENLKKIHQYSYPKKRKRFQLLVKKYGSNNYKETITKLITETWNILLNPTLKSVHELTNLKNHDFTQINNLSIGLKTVHTAIHKKRFCLVTGLDISHQKYNSRFLSEKSIMTILKNDKFMFQKLKSRYFPENENYGISVDQLCYYIAHNIRNKESNQRHSRIRRELKHQYNYKLFDIEKYKQEIDNLVII